MTRSQRETPHRCQLSTLLAAYGRCHSALWQCSHTRQSRTRAGAAARGVHPFVGLVQLVHAAPLVGPVHQVVPGEEKRREAVKGKGQDGESRSAARWPRAKGRHSKTQPLSFSSLKCDHARGLSDSHAIRRQLNCVCPGARRNGVRPAQTRRAALWQRWREHAPRAPNPSCCKRSTHPEKAHAARRGVGRTELARAPSSHRVLDCCVWARRGPGEGNSGGWLTWNTWCLPWKVRAPATWVVIGDERGGLAN